MAVEVTKEHLDVAERCVRKFTRRCADGSDVDAYRGAALESLARSAVVWNAACGGDFVTHAVRRMWHAMLDEGRRQAVDHRLKQPRPKMVSLTEYDAVEHDFADATNARVDRQRALERLHPRQRFALLASAAGFSDRETGAAIGTSGANVWKIRHGAVRLIEEAA